MKGIRSLSLVCLSFCIFGCDKADNPLLTAEPKQVTQWLYQAQLYAMQKTHFYYTSGSIYIACLEHPTQFDNPITKASGRAQCQSLLQAMVQFKTSALPIKQLTLAQLTDPNVARKFSHALNSYTEF